MSMPALRMLITLVTIIVLSIVKEIRRDGFQASDLFAFLSSEDFKNAIGPTIQSMQHIGEDFKGFGVKSGFEVARIAIDVSEQIYDEFTKPEAV